MMLRSYPFFFFIIIILMNVPGAFTWLESIGAGVGLLRSIYDGDVG